jgi:hypothetical protein
MVYGHQNGLHHVGQGSPHKDWNIRLLHLYSGQKIHPH